MLQQKANFTIYTQGNFVDILDSIKLRCSLTKENKTKQKHVIVCQICIWPLYKTNVKIEKHSGAVQD